MRSTSLLVAACALALAATNSVVVAAGEAQQSTVHLRIHAEGESATDAIAMDAAAALELTSQHQQHAKAYDSGPVHACREVTKESFARQIKNACVRRDGQRFQFYYQLTNGQVMRNCNCNDYNKGVQGVNLGTALARSPSVQCFTTEGKSVAAVRAIFNSKSIMCSPFEFE